MQKRQLGLFVLLLFLLAILSACAAQPSGSDSSKSITFTVPIDAEMFSEDASLAIRLWNADQLEILKRTADCAVSIDVESQVEEIVCPEGVEYEKVIPEEIFIPIQEISESDTFVSNRINVGEKYRLLISGLSKDDCNTTSASIEAIAQQAAITLENLEWATTEMGCL